MKTRCGRVHGGCERLGEGGIVTINGDHVSIGCRRLRPSTTKLDALPRHDRVQAR